MADDAQRLVTPETVAELARLAALPLAEDRRAALADDLERLLGDANAVNRFMDARRDVKPAALFHDPDPEGAQP